MSLTMETATPSLTVNGTRIDMIERGTGRPLLFLHAENGIEPAMAAIEALAKGARVIAPTHPGYGRSELPKGMRSVDDLSYFYLDLLDQLDLRDVALVGVSLGAWLAAEIAVKTTARLSKLVMANAVGVKVGDRETRDIADMFAMTEPQFNERAYADPTAAKRDYAAMPEGDVLRVARNRESLARFGWSPYMHDPKLKGRLHRIRVPTLVLWGESDRIAAPDYGRAHAAAMPGARFETIARAGHFPHLEQPDDFARRILAFAAG